MVKSFISAIIVSLLFVGLCFCEQFYLQNNFKEFREKAVIVYQKVEKETACKNDVESIQSLWLKKKESLHNFIPHTEIKEVDLWLAETVTLVENKKYEDAQNKLYVVIQLVEQIPKTFGFRIENIL